MGETAQLAERVAGTTYEEVPGDAIERAKVAARDVLGLSLHGSGHAIASPVRSLIGGVGTAGDATVAGRGTADATRAAFANGAFANVLNYSDTFESVVIHPSCTAFPAALAAGEAVGATGRDVLAGYVVGLDVLLRVGRSVAPSHWHHGWHSTATIGVFGAAAAAASVFGADAETVRRAFGVAGSLSSGLKKNVPTATNPIHCGNAAAKGVEAAMLARAGAVADGAILEGPFGYGAVMTVEGPYDPSEITDPAVEWAIRDVAFKPYPSGVVTHAAMEALREVLVAEDFAPADVESIAVTVDERVTDTVGEPEPRDPTEAGLSYEFCLAAVLRERDPGVHEFSDGYVAAPETRQAMEKIHVDPRPDPFGTDDVEASYGSRVVVETVDGRRYERTMLDAPGGPSNPLPEERLRAKFYECAGTVLDRPTAGRVEAAVSRLDHDDRALSDLCSAIGAG